MSNTFLCYAVLAGAAAFVGYTYVGYPLLLRLFARRDSRSSTDPASWPSISILLPVYNEEGTLRDALEGILALDYPPDRRQVLVASDASSDRTDAIAAEFAPRGVELVRLPQRGGKTATENYASRFLQGEIVVSVDASSALPRQSLKSLVAAFADPTVGVASGWNVSVGNEEGVTSVGESRYTRYDMWVRDLETRVYGIVGAAGCFYAQRADLYRIPLREDLSRDFAAALVAREHGYRAVKVREAVCLVPRSGSLQVEYRRKVRTASRGIATLLHQRHLLNPVRYGTFAWMLFSHKLCRWLAPLTVVPVAIALLVLAVSHPWARVLALSGLGLGLLALAGHRVRALRTLRAIVLYGLGAIIALIHSWWHVWVGVKPAWWEPTRRRSANALPAARA